jgi:hypothetical protein
VEFQALLTRWEEGQARDDRRAALTAWLLAEIHRDRRQRGRPYALEDFLLHRWPSLTPATPPTQTPQEQAAVLQAFFSQLGAVQAPT